MESVFITNTNGLMSEISQKTRKLTKKSIKFDLEMAGQGQN